MANALFSPYSGYILYDAAWTGTTPVTTYSLASFNYLRPDWRVVFASGFATLTATIGGSRMADVVAIPMSNCDDGTSPTICRLTNGSGLDVEIEFPSLPADSLPRTTVLDLRGLASAGVRTSNVWNFIFANNSVNLRFGAALWLGTLSEFTANFRPGMVLGETRLNSGEANLFGTVNRIRTRSKVRWAEFGVYTRDAQRDTFFEWARASEGSGLPSLFWPDPSVNDAFLGTWPDEFSSTWVVRNYSPMDGIRFTELSKGVPFL